jgi:hypothetical protein
VLAATLATGMPEAHADVSSAGEIVRDGPLVQTFETSESNLRAIRIQLATYARTNTCRLRIELRDAVSHRVVAGRFVSCAKIVDNADYDFRFVPLRQSKGRTYRLVLRSPDGTPGNAVTAWLVNPAVVRGKLTQGGRPLAGSLRLTFEYGRGLGRVLGAQAVRSAIFLFGLSVAVALRWRLWRFGHARGGTGSLQRYLAERRLELGALTAIFCLYMATALYGSFSDEYENLIGGRFILGGRLPNVDYFAHHMPLPYYLAAAIALFTGRDFFAARAVFALLLFVWAVCLHLLLRRHVSRGAGLCFVAFLASSMSLYWGHMLLAETLIAYAAATLLVLFLFRFRTPYPLGVADVGVVSALAATMVFSSLGWLFLAALCYALLLGRHLAQRRHQPPRVRLGTAIIVLLAPYLLFAGFLFAVGGMRSFIEENYTFNRHYYALFTQEIPRGPVEALVQTVGKAAAAVHLAAAGFPANLQSFFSLLAVATLLAELAHRRDGYGASVVVGFMALLSPRGRGFGAPWGGGPKALWEANFHGMPAIVVSILAASIAVGLGQRPSRENGGRPVVRLLHDVMVLVGIIVFVASLGFTVERYAQMIGPDAPVAPRPVFAEIVNDLTTEADAAWAGPYALDEVFHLRARPASHFHWLLPWHLEVEEYQRRFIEDLERTRPKVVVWRPSFNVWDLYDMDVYGVEVLRYLRTHYFQVEVAGNPAFRDLYFRRDRRDSIIQELHAKGYLR